MAHQTASPAIISLERGGLICKAMMQAISAGGLRHWVVVKRKTRRNRWAAVYVLERFRRWPRDLAPDPVAQAQLEMVL